MKKTPAYIAKHIRSVLKDGGSAPHTIEVQRFFKEEIKSRGWRARELRILAKRFHRTIEAESGIGFLLQVADQLFRGEVLEEKVFAVVMLQPQVKRFKKREFLLFESWLDRVSTWADHDALVHDLLGPILAADASLLPRPLRWARKKGSRWHQRAAAVSLIHSTRQHKNFETIRQVTELLLPSDDDMVQKGLGWLLREAVKANPKQSVEYLMTIREGMPRFVLRTACETLKGPARDRLLERAPRKALAAAGR